MKAGDGRPRGRVREGRSPGNNKGATKAPWESGVAQLTLQPNTVLAPHLLQCIANRFCTTHADLQGACWPAAAVTLLHGDRAASASGD